MLSAATAARFFITSGGAAVILDSRPPRCTRDPLATCGDKRSTNHKTKFDAVFLERRLGEHRAWQEQAAAELEYDVVREVVNAYRRGQK